ncbi:MAG: SRPBCC family protein [Nocardioides sp.]
MSTNTHLIHAPIDQVWEVLCDGWLYPLWVVGASRMREVDDTWPSVGSRLHHSVGSWPLLLDDTTEVLECEPRARLVLRARAWPTGEAQVALHLRPRGPDTEIVMEEQAVRGPGRFAPKFLQDPPLTWRNVEALRRLAYVVENRP